MLEDTAPNWTYNLRTSTTLFVRKEMHRSLRPVVICHQSLILLTASLFFNNHLLLSEPKLIEKRRKMFVLVRSGRFVGSCCWGTFPAFFCINECPKAMSSFAYTFFFLSLSLLALFFLSLSLLALVTFPNLFVEIRYLSF